MLQQTRYSKYLFSLLVAKTGCTLYVWLSEAELAHQQNSRQPIKLVYILTPNLPKLEKIDPIMLKYKRYIDMPI
jgi:hypothetical protein